MDPAEIEKRFDSLPPDIKKLVYGADMLNALQKIGEKHKLHIDQVGTLEGETADVMTGFSKPEDFAKNIATSLNIDAGKATEIANDISNDLFAKIRESMKKIAEEQKKDSPVVSAPVTPAPTMPKPPLTAVLPTKTAASTPATPSAPTAKKPPAAPPPPRALAQAPKPPPVAPSPRPGPQAPAPKAPPVTQADVALTQKTVVMPKPPAPTPGATATAGAKQEPPKPINYKADPYREPPE